ncbi:MAG: [protein-PII] uridylyltransferase, partial [Candidatus Latescibacterota bacterium]|nr:[protein-PII] uridylyltransferase [Candidatus Latescibacterota bacterium]
LNPKSDIDLLFIFNEVQKNDPITRSVLHTLWDLRFEVGYSTRSISDCVQAGQEDVESLTAMLESRYLVGDTSLHDQYREAMTAQFTGRKAKSFVQQKISERVQRTTRYSVQLQEPNIKENPGGLRDSHTMGWLLMARRNKRAPKGLLEEHLLSQRAYQSFIDALNYVLRVRNELHFQTEMKRDVLEHDLQPQIAKGLGYTDTKYEMGVEQFMRDYYGHARTIDQLTNLVCEKLGNTSVADKALDLIVRRPLDDGAILSHKQIQLPKRRRAFFEQDPYRLLTLFLDAQHFGARINHTAQQAIRDNLHLIDDEFRSSPKAARTFFEILRSPADVAITLRRMHDLGVLDAYIPEFGGLSCLVQYNLYHVYSADEHTLVTIRNLENLGLNPALPPDLKPFRRLYNEVSHRELLYIALLMHDVGKARRGKDHSVEGAEMSRTFLERIGLPEPHIQSVVFLVKHHLNMSHISQRRDIGDDEMIADFAKQFRSQDDLRMLCLLTYADLSGVTKTAWSTWKGQLLWELFVKTFNNLTGSAETSEQEVLLEQIIPQMVQELGGRYPVETIENHLRSLPIRYAQTVRGDKAAAHLRLIEQLKKIQVSTSFTESREFSEVTICTNDFPYRLSQICGVLATNDLNIISAQAYTRKDGIVIDTFQVTYPDGVTGLDTKRRSQIQRQLEKVFGGRTKIRELFEKHKARWSRKRLPTRTSQTELSIDNQISDQFTVIDVFAHDEVGLLYRITDGLSDLNLDISTARISTQADRVIDSFYVQHKEFGKISDPDALTWIRAKLLEKLADK